MKWARLGFVRINNSKTSINHRILEGDLLQIHKELIPQLATQPTSTTATSPPSLAKILVLTEDLAVLNKSAGQSMYDGPDSVRTLCQKLGTASISFSPTPCHRLDTNTSGPVLCALTRHAATKIQELFAQSNIEKHYLALLPRSLAPKTYTHLLYRDSTLKKSYAQAYSKNESSKPNPQDLMGTWQRASMSVRGSIPLRIKNLTFMLHLITPHTGRTHQIRVQCAALGSPLINDTKYGGANVHIDKRLSDKNSKPAPLFNKKLNTYFLHCLHLNSQDIDFRAFLGEKTIYCPLPLQWSPLVEQKKDIDQVQLVQEFLCAQIPNCKREITDFLISKN